MRSLLFNFLLALTTSTWLCIAHHGSGQEPLGNHVDALQYSAMENQGTNSPRHRIEQVHLTKRLERKTGKWNAQHPRHRLLEAMYSFLSYKERALPDLERWRSLYKNVSKSQKAVLEKVVKYKAKLDEIEERIYMNSMLCKSMVASAMEYYHIEQKEIDQHIAEAKKANRQADKISVTQILKHYVRDWADEGGKERNDGFPCTLSIIEQVKREIGKEGETQMLKVLLPGAGLGRLGHEVEALGGFQVTINEWSSYMNIAYRYLYSNPTPNSSAFHPFVDSLSHHVSTADLLRPVSFPNVSPSPSVLMVEGDFTDPALFSNGDYDVIVTYFFIDTARNLLSYFETIHRLLRKGGYWINFGPLLYGTGPFVQLSLDEVLDLVEGMGFEFIDIGNEQQETQQEEEGGNVENACGELTFEQGKVRWKEAEYGFNAKALTKNAYRAQAWLARKK